jgi:hypothetical protein
MRVRAMLVSLAFIASASAQPRIVGRVSEEDVRGMAAAIRAVSHDRIVFIRATPSADRAGVQTESGPSAGCQYLLQRNGSTWTVAGKSCWTHTVPSSQDAEKRWPRIARPSELSEADFSEIKTALAKYTHDEIRTIKVTGTSPLSVRVHSASPHVVTEGDFTLQKVGIYWQVTQKSQWIH